MATGAIISQLTIDTYSISVQTFQADTELERRWVTYHNKSDFAVHDMEYNPYDKSLYIIREFPATDGVIQVTSVKVNDTQHFGKKL